MNPSDREKPRIALLGNDPGDCQWSMLEYGSHLYQRLCSQYSGQMHFTLNFPDTRKSGLRLRQWRIGRAAATYTSRYLLYPRILRRIQAETYHILDHGNAWLIRYLDPTKTVVTCHDLIPLILSDRQRSLCPWFSQRAFRQALTGLTRAAKILANSQKTRQDLIAQLRCSPDRIEVIPLGIDPCLRPPSSPEEVQAARRAFGLPDREILLLHVGQNVFYKNIEGLLQAMNLLCQRGQPVRLVQAGSFLNSIQTEIAARSGLKNRPIELGSLPREKLRQLYWAADILVYPSWYEGLGLPPLEALACGLPAIVSDRGALPDTVGGAALVVNPDSIEQIADAVERLLHDPTLRQELRSRGVARAAHFRWETTAERTFQIYRSLLP